MSAAACGTPRRCTGASKAQAGEQRVHRAKTREFHRMAQRLFWGSTTVRGRFWGTQLRVGYKPWGARHGVDPRELRPPPAIVGWGNGKGGGGGAPIVEFSRTWVLREYCGRRHGCIFFLVRECLPLRSAAPAGAARWGPSRISGARSGTS